MKVNELEPKGSEGGRGWRITSFRDQLQTRQYKKK